MTKFSVNPLKTCKLRIAGLASIKGAMFGMTRSNKDGSPRAHQGIDLATDEGYRCYAVEAAKVVSTVVSENGYGNTVTLQLITENPNLQGKFAFYAHLKRIDVKTGQTIEAGSVIGLSGETGNAANMTTVDTGGHLHFELRTKQICGTGLAGRVDPLPFINLTK